MTEIETLRSELAEAKAALEKASAAPTLLERGQALAEALEIEMDGGGGRSAQSRQALAAWRTAPKETEP